MFESTTIPTSSPPWTSRRSSGGSSSIVSRSFSSAGLPASSPITWPSPAVIVSSGPIGAAPCETIGSTSTPSSRTPTAPSLTTSSPMNRTVSSSSVRPDASPPSSGSIGVDSLRKRSTASVGEGHRVGEQDRAVGAVEVGHAGQRAGARLELLDGGVERRSRSRRRGSPPTRTPPSRPRSRARGRSRRPRRSRSARPARAPRGSPRAPPPAPRGARRRRTRPRGRRPRRRAPRPPPTPPRAPPRAGRARSKAGADADGHGPVTILRGRAVEPRAPRPYWPPMQVIAVFGPTGVGKTAVAIALAERLRERGEDPVAVSADAMQVYAGPADPHRGGHAQPSRPSSSTGCSASCRSTETFSAGAYAQRAHAEIDALIAAGRRPIVVGGTGLYLRAALADLDLSPPVDPAIRARGSPQRALDGAARRAAAQPSPPGSRPTDRQRIIRAHELLATGHEPPPPATRRQLWTDAHAPPDAARRAGDGPRARSYARIDARVDAMVAARRAPTRSRAAHRPAPPPPPAARSASRSCSTATSRP